VIILGATLRRSLAVLNGRVPVLDVVEA